MSESKEEQLWNEVYDARAAIFEDRFGTLPDDIQKMLHLVEKAHLDMCPQVPMAGWDVVLSADPKLPVCLLEVTQTIS